ncbi:MAG: hypothetical protein AAGI27_04010 [Pseudomonadota bacterium]
MNSGSASRLLVCIVVLVVLPVWAGHDKETPVSVVNQQDVLPAPQPIESFIDTRGMSERKFQQALKSWKGVDARQFDLTWGSVLERDFSRWGDGERVYQLKDQDLLRIRSGLIESMCTTLACRQNFDVPLNFADDDTRRIRSCTVTVRVADDKIDRIRIDNDGCRYNSDERDASRYDPDRDPSRQHADVAIEAAPSP